VGKSRSGAVAVPGRFERAAVGEEVHQCHLECRVGPRHADEHHGASEVAGVERLLPRCRAANRIDHDVGAVSVGQFLDGGHHIGVGGIDGMGGAKVARPLQFRIVESTAMMRLAIM
jgi:hypothetical protein